MSGSSRTPCQPSLLSPGLGEERWWWWWWWWLGEHTHSPRPAAEAWLLHPEPWQGCGMTHTLSGDCQAACVRLCQGCRTRPELAPPLNLNPSSVMKHPESLWLFPHCVWSMAERWTMSSEPTFEQLAKILGRVRWKHWFHWYSCLVN